MAKMYQHWRGEGGTCHLVRISSKPYALRFDDVTCIYHHEIWHVYKVNCQLLPLTEIILQNTTIFTQLTLFLKCTPCQGHAMHCGRIISPCIGRLIMPCDSYAYKLIYCCVDHAPVLLNIHRCHGPPPLIYSITRIQSFILKEQYT